MLKQVLKRTMATRSFAAKKAVNMGLASAVTTNTMPAAAMHGEHVWCEVYGMNLEHEMKLARDEMSLLEPQVKEVDVVVREKDGTPTHMKERREDDIWSVVFGQN